jgi:hypothetical protein
MPPNLSAKDAIEELTRFWEMPNGFFYKLREGKYDTDAPNEVRSLLERVTVTEEMLFPRRFVALVWMIPTFMEWQSERVGDNGGDVAALQRDANGLRSIIENLFGVP